MLPAFDLQAEVAALPAAVRQELAAAASSSGEGQKQPSVAQSSAPALGLPPEPEPADYDAVPAILQATVDPPMAKAGDLVTVTVVISAEGDLPAGTLASDLPRDVTFASTLGERTVFLTAGRRLQRSLSAVANGGKAAWSFQLRIGPEAPDLTVLPIRLDVPGLEAAYGEAEIGRLFPPSEAGITPEKGGSLRSADGRIELVFPAGAVDQPLSIRHTPRAVHRLGAKGSGQALEFELEAVTGADAAVQSFKKPYRLRVDFGGLVDFGLLAFCQYPSCASARAMGPGRACTPTRTWSRATPWWSTWTTFPPSAAVSTTS